MKKGVFVLLLIAICKACTVIDLGDCYIGPTTPGSLSSFIAACNAYAQTSSTRILIANQYLGGCCDNVLVHLVVLDVSSETSDCAKWGCLNNNGGTGNLDNIGEPHPSWGACDTNEKKCDSITGYECFQLQSAPDTLHDYLVRLTIHRKCAVDTSYNMSLKGGCYGAHGAHIYSGLGDSAVIPTTGRINTGGCVDTVINQDGVNTHWSLINGSLAMGTCMSNGWDSTQQNWYSAGNNAPAGAGGGSGGIAGQLPQSADSIKKDTMTDNSQNGLTGKEFGDGINKLLSAIDSNTAAAVANEELLNQIKNSTKATAQNQTSGLGNGSSSDTLKFDSTNIHYDTSALGNNYDTALSNLRLPSPDSSGELAYLRNKMDTIRRSDSTDTNVTGLDSSQISSIFTPFKVSWGDTDQCDCDSTALSFSALGSTHNINVCFGDIAQYTRWLFKLIAAFIMFMFYRTYIFKFLFKLDQFFP